MPTKSALLKNKDKPKEFYDGLIDIWWAGRTENKTSESFKSLIVELNNANGINVCQLGAEAISDGINPFDVMNVLEGAIPDLSLEIGSFVGLLEKLYCGTQNDLLAHIQYQSIDTLVEKQPDFSRQLLTALLEIDRPFIQGYIASLFRSISVGNEEQTQQELEVLKEHNSVHVINGLINALSNLNYKVEKGGRLLKKTFQIFDFLEGKEIEDIDACTAHAYGQLINVSSKASERILHYADKNKPLVDYAISRVLFLNAEEHGDEGWFRDSLRPLSRTLCDHKGAIDNLDYILSALIEKKKNSELVETFFVNWLLESDYSGREDKLADLFGSTFAAFVKEKNFLWKFITRLFNHDNHKVHNAASEVTRFCNLHKIEPLKFDRNELGGLEEKDILYIVRKVLGYVIDSKTQSSLILSLLDKSPRNKKLQSLVHSVFVGYIGVEYPRPALEFLKQELISTKGKIKPHLIRDAINEIEKSLNEREQLTHLKEIMPPSQQINKVLLEQDKVMSASMKEARKGGISNLFKNILLKDGNGSFSYVGNDYRSVSKLSSHSSYFELPCSEIFHPVHAAIERAGFRRASRGD